MDTVSCQEKTFELLKKTSVLATFVSHRRSQRRIRPNQSLLKIENVDNKILAEKYLNHVLLFCYYNKENVLVRNYGYICGVHGNKGVVRAKFERNLNPRAIGQVVYVKLYKK